MLPPAFQQQMQARLGDEYPAFVAALESPTPTSIRLNPAKRPVGGLGADLTPVPWHPDGRYLPERPIFTLDPLLHAGAYYVQEASSMFLYEALRQTADFSKPLKILDLCAAPGGKSTLLAAMQASRGLLVANEVIRARTGALRENLTQWGTANVAITSVEAPELGALEGWFDVVVADAPCSGEGLFRKDPAAIQEWSPAHVAFCSARQRRILADIVPAIAPGGLLAYSTCTYNEQENEDNVDWLVNTLGFERLPLSVPAEWGLSTTSGGAHFYPHRTTGEGFFIAVLRKTAGAAFAEVPPAGFRQLKPVPKAQLLPLREWVADDSAMEFWQTPAGTVLALPSLPDSAFQLIDATARNKWFGVPLGSFKGKDFIPDHGLALSTLVRPDLPALDLTREQALLFLKKEVFPLPENAPRGWALARFAGLNIGWLKVLPNRMNNYLPSERRIRMDLA